MTYYCNLEFHIIILKKNSSYIFKLILKNLRLENYMLKTQGLKMHVLKIKGPKAYILRNLGTKTEKKKSFKILNYNLTNM